MDIDVHRSKGQMKVKYTGGEFAHHDGTLISFFQGGHSSPAADVPAVDKEILHASIGPAGSGCADKALHRHMSQLVVYWDQC